LCPEGRIPSGKQIGEMLKELQFRCYLAEEGVTMKRANAKKANSKKKQQQADDVAPTTLTITHDSDSEESNVNTSGIYICVFVR